MSPSTSLTDLLAYNFNLETSGFSGASAGATPHQHISHGLLHDLAREGDVLTAETLMDAGVNIDAPNEDGRRPLHEAAQYGQLHMVRFLVQAGAVVDAPLHPFGYTALYYAVEQGHIDIARYLLSRGANTAVTDRLTGQGLLHLAAQRGDMQMAGLLIACGINALYEDRRGQTARDYAARHNYKELEQVLVKVMAHHAMYGG